MGYTRMTPEQVHEFLTTGPARPAVLGTTRRDGRPHLAPVWYLVEDDGTICFTTGDDTVKGRTLARTGRAALTVQDDRAPFSYVTVEGPVELVDDLDTVAGYAARLGGRYMGPERAEEYGRRNGVPGELLVRLTPEKVVGLADVAD